MIKQRRDSIAQYEKAARQDLADVEKFEIGVLHGLPAAAAERGRGRRRRSPRPIAATGAKRRRGHGQGDGAAEAASSPAAPTWARCRPGQGEARRMKPSGSDRYRNAA